MVSRTLATGYAGVKPSTATALPERSENPNCAAEENRKSQHNKISICARCDDCPMFDAAFLHDRLGADNLK